MIFKDNIVICSKSKEQVEANLEKLRKYTVDKRGMKVSGRKTEYICAKKRKRRRIVRLQGVELDEFKYLGSTIQINEVCKERCSMYVGRRLLRMKSPGRKRQNPKKKFMDTVREDKQIINATKDDAKDMVRWRWVIRCGDPKLYQPKEEGCVVVPV